MLYGQLADLRARAARYAAPVAALTMHAAKSVRGVKPSAVGGQLRFADGSSPAGVPIEIEIQAGGAAWTYYAGAVANADGSWLASVSLPYSANLRAVFPGDSRPRMESKAVAVKVVRDLQFTLGSKRPRRRRAVKLTGTVSPASRRVTVNFQRRVRPPLGARAVQADPRQRRRVRDDRAPAACPAATASSLSAGSAKRTRSFRAR